MSHSNQNIYCQKALIHNAVASLSTPVHSIIVSCSSLGPDGFPVAWLPFLLPCCVAQISAEVQDYFLSFNLFTPLCHCVLVSVISHGWSFNGEVLAYDIVTLEMFVTLTL